MTTESLDGFILDSHIFLLTDKLAVFKNKNSRLNKLFKVKRMKNFLTHPYKANNY